MQLAKQHLDVGLFTTDLPGQLAFWQLRVGLTFDHMLKVGDGVQQHRFYANGSIIKINHSRHPLPVSPPSGFAAIHLATSDVREPVQWSDADENRLVLDPPGFDGIVGLAVELEVSDIHAARRFWADTLGFPAVSSDVFRVGDSLVILQASEHRTQGQGVLRANGWRYLTIQVDDCRYEHRLALFRGAVEAAPPRDLGGVAVVSFIRDQDGNFIELSERTSLRRASTS